jgi:Tfp pilus assembly protein PilF
MRKRAYEAAESAIDQALAIDPNDSDTLFVKAGILDETGRKRQARQLLKQAAVVDPGNDLVQWATEYSIQQRNQRLATNTLYYGGGIATAVGVGLWETLKAVVDHDGRLK